MKKTFQALGFSIMAAAATGFASAQSPRPSLLYFGHDSIALSSPEGNRVVCDPYGNGSVSAYEISPFPKDFTARAVTVSHSHWDHANHAAVAGNPELISRPGIYRLGDIHLTAYEDREGSPRGPSNMPNLICVFETGGVKVVHLGDSGIVTDSETLKGIDGADVVVVNIDGYVIPSGRIMDFMRVIHARAIFPAHWEGLSQLERFIEARPPDIGVAREGNRIDLEPGMPIRILVMQPQARIKD